MQLSSYYLQRHDNGAFLQNGKAYVYLTGTGTLASLFNAGGGIISNPATADANGMITFKVADGTYDLLFQSSDGSYTSPPFNQVQIYDMSQIVTIDATTARTLALADGNTYLRFTNAGAVTLTVPPNSAVPFALGTVVEFEQAGAGVVTLAPGAGVTINSRGAFLGTNGQFAVGSIKKVALPDTWTATGDI